jgi:hypothetical protein
MNASLFTIDGVPVGFTEALEQELIKTKGTEIPIISLVCLSSQRKIDTPHIARMVLTFQRDGVTVNAVILFDTRISFLTSLSYEETYPHPEPDGYWDYVRWSVIPKVDAWMRAVGSDMFRKVELRETAIYKKMLEAAINTAIGLFRADGCEGNLFFRPDGHSVSSDRHFLTVEDIDVTTAKSTIKLAYGHARLFEKPDQHQRVEVSIHVDANDINNWKTIRDFVMRQVVVLIRPQLVVVHESVK